MAGWDNLETAADKKGGTIFLESGGFVLLAGRYKAVIEPGAGMVERNKYRSEETEEQLQVVFKTMNPFTEEQVEELGLDEGCVGMHGYITNWIPQRTYQLEDPKDGKKSSITVFLDNYFGRKLTEEEVAQFSILNFAKKIAGAAGFVTVATSQTGGPKFDSFIPAKSLKPEPSNYFRGAQPLRNKSDVTGTKAKTAPNDDELPDDVFADE